MLLFEHSASACRSRYTPLGTHRTRSCCCKQGKASPADLQGWQPVAQHINQVWGCYLMCHTVCGRLECFARSFAHAWGPRLAPGGPGCVPLTPPARSCLTML